ncbi:MAG TPA: YslB family protein [Bacillales bacterium]|nr:YslB family protein [Bacillales bacterium]
MEQIKDHVEEVPAFAYELLRDVLIPELLGKEQSSILYWAGKNLARQYPFETVEEIVRFFDDAGWGSLSVDAERRNKMTFTLRSPMIAKPRKNKNNAAYTLETGFLAQQIQMIKNRVADAQSTCKSGSLGIVVEWDHKDIVDPSESESRRSRSRRRTS